MLEDGDMHGLDQREKDRDRFRAKPEVKVLLISPHAGSMGLNPAARRPLFLPLVHPFLQAQAVERVHRIGQRRPVRVVRCICDTAIDRACARCRGPRGGSAARYPTGRVFTVMQKGKRGGRGRR